MGWLPQLKNLNSSDIANYISDYHTSAIGCNRETKEGSSSEDPSLL